MEFHDVQAESGIATDFQREKIRVYTSTLYSVQKLRVAVGNRIVASMRPVEVEGIAKADCTPKKARTAATTEEERSEEDAKQKERDSILAKITKEYSNITEYLASQHGTAAHIQKYLDILGPDLTYIKTRTDFDLITHYGTLCQSEAGFADVIKREVQKHPMWDAFFKDVGGCGPLMSAVCLSYLDPYKARHASSFWRYAGLDVAADKDGKMRGVGTWYTVDRNYIDRDGNAATKKGLTYSPFLKTKLCGVLGSAFLRCRGESKYRDIYYNYKNRISNRAVPEGEKPYSPGHIHRMATRYAVKIFLADMWVAWRTLENLPVSEPYSVAFLGRQLHHAPLNEPVSNFKLPNEYY